MPTAPPQLSSETWFARGEQFLLGGGVLSQTDARVALPMIVCEAFAAEAYLKCLRRIADQGVEPVHSLSQHFRALPNDDREQLEFSWAAEFAPKPGARGPDGRPMPRTLEAMLIRAKNAFIEWRYAALTDQIWASAIPQVIRRRVYFYRPEWQANPPPAF